MRLRAKSKDGGRSLAANGSWDPTTGLTNQFLLCSEEVSGYAFRSYLYRGAMRLGVERLPEPAGRRFVRIEVWSLNRMDFGTNIHDGHEREHSVTQGVRVKYVRCEYLACGSTPKRLMRDICVESRKRLQTKSFGWEVG